MRDLRLALLLEPIDDVVAAVEKPFDAVDEAVLRASVKFLTRLTRHARVPAFVGQRVDQLLEPLLLRLRLQEPLHARVARSGLHYRSLSISLYVKIIPPLICLNEKNNN